MLLTTAVPISFDYPFAPGEVKSGFDAGTG
jgi:hypothetical protein